LTAEQVLEMKNKWRLLPKRHNLIREMQYAN